MTKYFLLLIMVIPQFANSQDTYQISYGENRVDALGQIFDSDLYRFEGSQGDRIWIRVADAASNIDASFRLRKGDVLLTEVEGTGGDVEIFDFHLPESGIYDIQVYDRGSNDSGAYGISLHKLNNPTYARQIRCGDDLTDQISTEVGVMVYQFEVHEGDLAFAQIRAESSHFESTLYLFNEAGDLLRKSVRKANAYAFISAIDVPFSEKYSLFAFDANGNDLSRFGLTYQDLNDPSCGLDPLSCIDHVEAKIGQLAQIHAYEVSLSDGQGFVAKVMAPSKSFEAVAEVYDPLGQQLFYQRVSGKASDVVIPSTIMNGSYTMLISDDRANDTSSYYLSYNTLDLDCAEELPTCRSMTGQLDHKTDINLYYFMMPEQMNGLLIKEIDRVIEPFVSIIQAPDYSNQKDNVKLNIAPPIASSGSIIYIAVSDNGGNDLGRFQIDFVQENKEPILAPPVALCQSNLAFTIPPSGMLELSAEHIDGGSYDDCLIVQMNVTPNLFDCTTLGLQEVVLEVIDNEGLSTTCTTQIEILSDLELILDECIKIPVADFDIEGCIDVVANATGGSGEYHYVWSNGETGPLAQVCPEDVPNLSCEVFDGNGCTASQDLWLPIGVNVLCHANGSKVSICHIPPSSPEEKHTLCVSISSLKAHFDHEDYMGPCDGGKCDEENQVLFKKHPNGHITITGLMAEAGELIRVNLKDQLTLNNTKIEMTLVDALGRTLYSESAVATTIDFFELQLPSSGLSPGLYYLFLRTMDGSSRQVTAPILIK